MISDNTILELLTLAEGDRRLGLKVGSLANAFYRGNLPDSVCGRINGTSRHRRVIIASRLPEIAELLKQRKTN
jgi:hypothetical protein